jgi:hypothetical protein
MLSVERDYRDSVLNHTVLLQTEIDRLQMVIDELPTDHVCRDRFEQIHRSISNVIAVMKTDLVNLS